MVRGRSGRIMCTADMPSAQRKAEMRPSKGPEDTPGPGARARPLAPFPPLFVWGFGYGSLYTFFLCSN